MEVEPSPDALILDNLKKMAESAANEANRMSPDLDDANSQNNNDIFHPQKNTAKMLDDTWNLPTPTLNHINGKQDGRPMENGNSCDLGEEDELEELMNEGEEEDEEEEGEIVLDTTRNSLDRKLDANVSENGSDDLDLPELKAAPAESSPKSVHLPVTSPHNSVTPSSNSHCLAPVNTKQLSPKPAQSHTEGKRKRDDIIECGECMHDFSNMQEYIDHNCSQNAVPKRNWDEEPEALSDVESFDGKIVYNPDGSAYIIEGESDLSDADSLLEVPQVEGAIVDSKSIASTTQVPSFPQIANAFYIQRNPAAFYNTFYMFPPESRPPVEAPIMHSYRVYDVRSGMKDNSSNRGDHKDMNSDSQDSLSPPNKKQRFDRQSGDVATVPTKPILMCFICKLSFGYAKSFVAHAIGEHGMSLNEDEKEIMAHKNSSAIIQGVGKDKKPLMSFLEPNSPEEKSASETSDSKHPPLFSQPFSGSATNANNTNVSYMYPNTKVTPSEQGTQSGKMNSSYNGGSANSRLDGQGSDPLAQVNIQGSESEQAKELKQTSSKDSCDSPNNDAQSSRLSPQGDIPMRNMLCAKESPSRHMDKNGGSPVPFSEMKPVAASSPSGGLMSGQSHTTMSPSAVSMALSPMSSAQMMSQSMMGTPSTSSQGQYVVTAGCEDHPNGCLPGIECAKCDMILASSRALGGHMTMMHSRNSCKTLKCPKCNWHYKYQETLEIHMKEKHPESDTQCIYCITNQSHPRLARGEVYTCGYKPYRCDVCNYSTTTKGNLSIHMQSDKHINNMQELQNGTSQPPEIKMPPTPPPHIPVPQQPAPPPIPDTAKKNKPKPTWRCDVCNYETNVARNLRIHMTSEKHTHNMMVLQQNVKHMQRDMHFQLSQMAMLGQDPMMAGIPPQMAATMPPFLYDQSMFMQPFPNPLESPMDLTKENLIQVPQGQLPFPMDIKNNNNEPSKIFQCSVCNVYSTDTVETLHQHMQADRSKQNCQDNITVVGGTYLCNLCSYKTNLKANFQLHCKTDKHLQRQQLVNHIREGGPNNEWRLKYMNMSNPVQVKCAACDYYTNSIHKLQLHMSNARHAANAKLFHHLQMNEMKVSADRRYYHCNLCQFSTRAKLNLIQHVRSMKHARNESMHLLTLREQGREHEYDMQHVFIVKEYNDGEIVKFDEQDEDEEVEEEEEEDDLQDDAGSSPKDVTPETDPQAQSETSPGTLDSSSKMGVGQIQMCPFCNFSSASESRMQAHIVTQHAQQPRVSCPLCQEMFSTKSSIEKHLIGVHNVTQEGLHRLLVLVEGNWNSSSNVDQNKHSPTAPTQAPTPTPPEEGSTEVKTELIETDAIRIGDDGTIDAVTISEKGEPEDQYRCQMCTKTFQEVDALYSHQNELGHLELKQTPRGPGYLCWKKGCNQYFKTASALQVHFREIHAKKPQLSISERHVYKFRCTQCSLAFKTLEKLQLHSHYHMIRAATKCTMCGRNFRTISALRKHVEATHLESMTELEIEQYQSNIATMVPLGMMTENVDEDEAMNNNEDSKEDVEMKSESRPDLSDSASDIASKDPQFFDEYINSKALAEDSYNNPENKYKCHRCKIAFAKQSYLSAHNKTLMHRRGDKFNYTMEKYLDPNRPYKCETCKESFTQKNILLVHFNSVSHLHKLKQVSQQQQQQPASQSPRMLMEQNTSSQNASPNVPHTPTSSQTAMPLTSTSPKVSPTESELKPYKCNICKVSYSQGTTLDIHMRSVLHQTRASKLQELVLTGQVDPTQPLIEQPDMSRAQQQQQKVLAEMLQKQMISPMAASPVLFGTIPPPAVSIMPPLLQTTPSTQSPHDPPSIPGTPVPPGTPQPSSKPQTPVPTTSNTTPTSTPTPVQLTEGIEELSALACRRCNSVFISHELLVQHQQMHCFNMPRNIPRYKPQLHRNLLENFGFECVMQFNEYYQKRAKTNSDDEKKLEDGEMKAEDGDDAKSEKKSEGSDEKTEDGEKEGEKGDENNESVKKEPEETPMDTDIVIKKEKPDEDEDDEQDMSMPEMNKCFCKKCDKEFSSIWVLKAHQEEIHRNMVPTDIIEEFSAKYRESLEKKHTPPTPPEPSNSAAENTESEKDREWLQEQRQQQHQQQQQQQQQHQQKLQHQQMLNEVKEHIKTEIPMPSLESLGFPPGMPMDFAALQAAQMMQMPLFNLLPFPMPMNMNLHPQLMPLMPPGASVDPSFVIPTSSASLSQNDPSFQVMQKQQQQAAAQLAQQQKRARTRISDEQLKILRNYFDINNSPSEECIIEMSDKSGLPQKVIKHWFRNTLFKERQRNKDSPYNFNNPPSTTLNLEEYEKTGKITVETPNASGSTNHNNPGDESEKKEEAKAEMPAENVPATSTAPSSVDNDEGQDSQDVESVTSTVSTNESVTSMGTNLAMTPSAPSTPAPTPSATHTELVSALTSNPFSQSSEFSSMAVSMAQSLLTTPTAPLSLATNIPKSSPHTPHHPHQAITPPHMSHSQHNPNSLHSVTKRANRTRFTDYQIKMLQDFFEQNAYPKDDDLDHLSKMLNLSPRVIVVWFQNARQKARKNYENQPPLDMSEDGVRYQRTPGLNYQCKKCMTVFQRYYELIRHQKTHCYKDQQQPTSRENSFSSSMVSPSNSQDGSKSTPSHTPEKPQTPASTPSAPSTPSSVSTPKKSSIEYKCDKCHLVFHRFDLWREHQNVHLMNPNLFPTFSGDSAFAMLQSVAQQQQQQQQQQQHQQQRQEQGGPAQPFTQHSSSEDDIQSPNKRKYEYDDEDLSRDDQVIDHGDHDQPRDKRLRTTILPEQLDYLYQKYQLDCNPSRKQLESIAQDVGLKKRVVQVWFQNTRARERKGQYRAHQQLIHKRCPFCRALFRARSALESHLATKHPEEFSKGDINIDNIPDAADNQEMMMSSSIPPLGSCAPGLDMNKLMANPYNMPNPFMSFVPTSVAMPPNDPVQVNMKRLYEDSLKKYLNELSSASHGPKMGPLMDSHASKVAPPRPVKVKDEEDDAPLDLSKPLRVSGGERRSDMPLEMSMHDDTARRLSLDDSRSETFSESTEYNDMDIESNPPSPNTSSSSLPGTSSSSKGQHCIPGKRYRTQMSNSQVRCMKHLFTDYKTPTMAECEMLGKEIGLAKRVVQVWFQNARAKEKKAKLSYAKTFGTDVDFSRPPEECKLCNFKYSHKFTIQDHIFTKRHIDNVRKLIASQGETQEGSYPEHPAAVPHGRVETPKGTWTPSSDPSLSAHPHLAQLHAMGLQAMPLPSPLPGLGSSGNGPSQSVFPSPEHKDAALSGGRIPDVKVKVEPKDGTPKSSKQKGPKDSLQSSSLANALSAPFGGMMPGAGSASAGAAAAAEMGAYMQYMAYPSLGGFYPGMGMMPGMMPPMMPGADMFMYDPATFGTPLALLQIPQQAIQVVQAKTQEENIVLSHYTQDCKTITDLKTLVSENDFMCARQTVVDVGYICKKCNMVYPGRTSCINHQMSLCYQGKTIGTESKTILKLEQIQYECRVCKERYSTQEEFKTHCHTDTHRERANKWLNSANRKPQPPPPPPPPAPVDKAAIITSSAESITNNNNTNNNNNNDVIMTTSCSTPPQVAPATVTAV